MIETMNIQLTGSIARWEEITDGVELTVTVHTEGTHQGIDGNKIHYPKKVIQRFSHAMLGQPVFRFHSNIDGRSVGYHKAVRDTTTGFDARLTVYHPETVLEIKSGFFDSVSMEADVWASGTDELYDAEEIDYKGTALLSSQGGTRGADPNAKIHAITPVALESNDTMPEDNNKDKYEWPQEAKETKAKLEAENTGLKDELTKLKETTDALTTIIDAQNDAKNTAKADEVKKAFPSFEADKILPTLNQVQKDKVLDFLVSLASRESPPEDKNITLSDVTSEENSAQETPETDSPLDTWCQTKLGTTLEALRKEMRS